MTQDGRTGGKAADLRAGSIRARVRAEMIGEIKAVARNHLATDGANLSLRAVARDMGMVSSALYRYFPSRDDLLTALILDAYNALGDAVLAADAAITDRARLRVRWLAAGNGVRDWALATPAEYALIYGSPVPGYAAPRDTAVAASRTPEVLLGILTDGCASGALPAEPGVPLAVRAAARPSKQLQAELTATRDAIAPGLPEPLFLAAMTSWVLLFGMVSFELFGQFNNVIVARAEFFTAQLELMADLMGL
jgi:AcrR family transcriptional regulator